MLAAIAKLSVCNENSWSKSPWTQLIWLKKQSKSGTGKTPAAEGMGRPYYSKSNRGTCICCQPWGSEVVNGKYVVGFDPLFFFIRVNLRKEKLVGFLCGSMKTLKLKWTATIALPAHRWGTKWGRVKALKIWGAGVTISCRLDNLW